MEFTEGSVSFEAPKGDATKKMPVFYNPAMEFDRDLTVSILRAVGGDRYCDALAGSGIRGMRAFGEAGFREVYFNDSSPEAVRLIGRNLEKNGISAHVFREDVNLFLRRFKSDKFDAIDIDPFGSFMPALDSALRAVKRKGGLLCLTATDTAPLCGVSVNTCLRRYGARPMRTSFCKEVGLRTLIGACARAVAKYDFALRPLFCYNRRHYFRLFLQAERSMKAANSMLREMAYLQHCPKCDWRGYAKVDRFREKCDCGGLLNWGGPLWSGRFADPKLKAKSGNEKVDDLLKTVKEEQKITLPFFDLHHLSELNRCLTPKKKTVMGSLKKATETHFARTGIRSDELPLIGP